MKTLRHHLALIALLVAASAPAEPIQRPVQDLLSRYCLDCHDTDTQKGELDLERFTSMSQIAADSRVWENVLHQIVDGEMPPKKKPQLSVSERQQFLAWLRQTLDGIALANAGDPGPVILRRLSNHEYTYTIRDLTGVDTLNPAHQFPVDGAAGEGFTNVGSALVMSPALLAKYLDAAKSVAAHAVLLPDRIDFSASTSRADWTQEKLDAIREIYGSYTVPGAEAAQNLQGIKFATKDGGVIPIERYLRALMTDETKGLSAKYLAAMKQALEDTQPSAILDPIRKQWQDAEPDDVPAIAKQIAEWQRGLWYLTKVGHIGKRDGPPAWQIPVSPVVTEQRVRLQLPPAAQGTTLYLAAGTAGDGARDDTIYWRNAVLELPDQSRIPLARLKGLADAARLRQTQELARTADYLRAISGNGNTETLDPDVLAAWREFIGGVSLDPTGHLTGHKSNVGGYDFVKALGQDLPVVLVNQSDNPVDIGTLTVPARGLTVHPTPTVDAIVIWKSPISGTVSIKGDVADGDDKCGNGAAWKLELVQAAAVRRLAGEAFANGRRSEFANDSVTIRRGDLLRLTVASHQNNHVCDTTALNLTISEKGGEARVWDLAGEIVDRLSADNPITDALGNKAVWHFCKSDGKAGKSFVIPAESALGKWRAGDITPEAVQETLTAPRTDADRAVAAQVTNLRGVFNWIDRVEAGDAVGDVRQTAPSTLEFAIPEALVAKGAVFTASIEFDLETGPQGSVQAFATLKKPIAALPLIPGEIQAAGAGKGKSWTAGTQPVASTRPILVRRNSEAGRRLERDVAAFQSLFPAALCYSRIVPVDEVVTLTLRYREDHHLTRLMLDDRQSSELDQLWQDLLFVSRQPLQQLDAFNQLWQYATQDADPSVFEPMRQPIKARAAAFSRQLEEVEPVHLQSVMTIAEQAWRRPLSEGETTKLQSLYKTLRDQELAHEDAIRQLLARVFVSPAFLYRGEDAAPGTKAVPVNGRELATRLSYFLWSSAPDYRLTAAAAAGSLGDTDEVAAQARRMLTDPKVRRLATEFGAQWLHVRDVDTLDEKSERHFPSFANLRDEMKEEVVLFFVDLFQNDGSILSLLEADHSFLNAVLAKHYGVDISGDHWRRVEGMRARGRGGILGFSATLAKHSGASRTSPILRGTWISEVVLGEKLPKPPKNVPVLPDEVPAGLTERQLIERHSSDPACARCHARIDPLGFALEGFDAIGRIREATDTRAELADGTTFDGVDGLRAYLLEKRRDDFVRQFCRKLLGYALGRSVKLSDKPLIDKMMAELAANDHRVHVAIDLIVRSPQFRNVRGRDYKIQRN